MNFYKERIVEIEYLIQGKNYLKALDLINDDLSAPYLPKDYENKIQNLLIEIQEKIQEKNINLLNKETKILPFAKIKAILLSTKLNMFHSFCFSFLMEYNLEKIIEIAKIYLSNPKYDSKNKSFLFFFLQKNKINQTFLLQKNDHSKKINPVTFDDKKLWSFFKDTENFLLTKILFQENAIWTLNKNLLMDFYCFFYPFFPSFFKTKELACVIYFQISQMLNKKINIDYFLDKFKLNVKIFHKINLIFEKKIIF